MSANGDGFNIAGQDANDHQPAYIFALGAEENAFHKPEPPAKKRKTGKRKRSSAATATLLEPESERLFKFEPLLDGFENPECVALRQELFERSWAETDQRIQSILIKANEDTLVKVTSFVKDVEPLEGVGRLPTGFIATGPNIASQSLLFAQLSKRLRTETNGPVVNLRSGDSSNLKAVLKQVIRDATNQKLYDDDEELSIGQGGRKYLNYDLEILHDHVKTYGCRKVVVAFQDSEAFEPAMLADIITLFNSWVDRIPFTLLFGIATSVEIFHERLSRAASRCLYGVKFDVAQTNTIIETIFQKAIASPFAPLGLGPDLLSSLVERQRDHVQSVQAFTAALKYAYMCHFYSNPLAILSDMQSPTREVLALLEPRHLAIVRGLPSFRHLIEATIEVGGAGYARQLLEDDHALVQEIEEALTTRNSRFTKLLRRIFVLKIANESSIIGPTEIYMRAFEGGLSDSDLVKTVLDSVKRMPPDALVSLVSRILAAIQDGCDESDLVGWLDDEMEFVDTLSEIWDKTSELENESTKIGKPVRSSYSMHSQGVRTTVVAQKVQLSYEKSTLSKHDMQFTELVDNLLKTLKRYLSFENPRSWFLNETWVYDSVSPYKDVFTPRPRFAVERALSTPSNYLPGCDPSIDVPSAKPPTAIVYQMYLESGNLVNVSDIWEAFHSHVGGEEGTGYDERTALMLLYRGLADLKLLGMVKQSKKKADHLAKSVWKGL